MGVDEKLSEAAAAIFAEIPAKLAIRAILLDAHARLKDAALEGLSDHERDLYRSGRLPAVGDAIKVKIAEVLREIASSAVEEFTRRTGEPFLWVDDPLPPVNDTPIMSFHLDARGNVCFGPDPSAPDDDRDDRHDRSSGEE